MNHLCRCVSSLLVTVGLAVALIGCGGPPGQVVSSPASSNSSETGDQTPKVSQAEQAAEAACTAALAKSSTKSTAKPLGRTYRYRDGLAVQLADPHKDTVAPYATGAYPGEPAFRMTLRVTNRANAGFSTAGVNVEGAYDEKAFSQVGVPGGVEEIDDSRTRGDLPDSIPAGGSGTTPLAFLVPARCVDRLIFQVTIDPKRPSVRFAATQG
jgi:hypothetical protein